MKPTDPLTCGCIMAYAELADRIRAIGKKRIWIARRELAQRLIRLVDGEI